MPHRIEVIGKDGLFDALGAKTAARVRENLGLEVRGVRTAQVYTIDADLSADELHQLAAGPFSDPIAQEAHVDRSCANGCAFDWLIEIGYLPGVTDNVGRTARESAEVRLGRKFAVGENVYTSVQYLVDGAVGRDGAERIARDLLANQLIQRWTIISAAELDRERGLAPLVPKVTREKAAAVETVDLERPDEELVRLSRERTLALSLDELHAIRDHYRDPAVREVRTKLGLPTDKPTDVELEALAQTWSEHCKHKIFAADITYVDGERTREINSLFAGYIKASTKRIRAEKGENDFCLSVFTDNAGVIRFNDEYSLVMKVETHNSPSALDPYGGALTGIVGVNRDPFGTGIGSRLIFNTDVFCFASPFWDKPLPPRLLHPKRIFEGVREGVEHGGNKSGIPTINGSIVFDDRFAGKPLVFCGTAGLLPATVNGKPGHEKEVRPGDLAVMAGGRIGADGIHGATMSSEELHEGSPATAVQIGDPITQKRMTDFLLVARDRGFYRSITDNGAGGLSSSIGEMARDSGGCEIHLERAPLKYAGLDPWMILLSESQERMTLAVPPEHWDAFRALAEKMEVEVTRVGSFTDTGRFDVFFDGKAVASLPMDFLHDGVPTMKLRAVWKAPALTRQDIRVGAGDWAAALKRVLGALDICSKEYVVRQYDHEVQAGSVVKPLTGAANDGPSDAGVWRPDLSSMEAVVVAHGLCPRYADADAFAMAANAVDEAVRNAVAVGGDVDYLAGLDNFCWCDPVKSESTPDGEYKLAQLVRANMALYDATVAYGVPCISGKDSMKNDYMIGETKISIPPTLLFTVVGKMNDARKAVTMDVKAPGDLVYVLGATRDELGCSEFHRVFGADSSAGVPRVDFENNLALYRRLVAAIDAGLVRSCHDCSDGGLAVALAETAFSGGLGMAVDAALAPTVGVETDEALLFAESAGRFVVTVEPDRAAAFEECLTGSPIAKIGTVSNDKMFRLSGLNGPLCEVPIDELKTAWKATLDFEVGRVESQGRGRFRNGVNCEIEMAHACRSAGADVVEIVSLYDLLSGEKRLTDYQFLNFPGGFLDGDDMGSGKAAANRYRYARIGTSEERLADQIRTLIDAGGCVIGVCNGFQLIVKLGLLPALGGTYFEQSATLTFNDSGRFEDRWIRMTADADSPCVFTRGIETLELPIRHGEGKFLTASDEIRRHMNDAHLVPLRYVNGDGRPTESYPDNPNGSPEGVAALCDETGRVFGMMPHPEAYQHRTNHPQWTRRPDLPDEGQGLAIFRNAVDFLRRS